MNHFVSHFVTKEVSIFYPYGDEVPYELLEQAGTPTERLSVLHDDPFIRVAKVGDKVIGVYLLTQLDAQTFRLDTLAVEADYRRRGLGSWLVGHAIGVSESKGGRRVIVEPGYSGSLFQRLGFDAHDDGWSLVITPE